MKDTLFNTQDKVDTAIANFTSLIKSPGWKLYVEILDANIEILKDRILSGVEGETKEEIDRLREKLRTYEELRDTPMIMIEKLSSPEEVEIDIDPYDTTDDIEKRKIDNNQEE